MISPNGQQRLLLNKDVSHGIAAISAIEEGGRARTT
jgi:hypothetical protein